MASSQQNLYPFISSSDDNDACSISVDNNDEPIPHTDDDNNPLISHVESKITTIAASEAEKKNLHKDTVYGLIATLLYRCILERKISVCRVLLNRYW
jgi:hypothetical protein